MRAKINSQLYTCKVYKNKFNYSFHAHLDYMPTIAIGTKVLKGETIQPYGAYSVNSVKTTFNDNGNGYFDYQSRRFIFTLSYSR